MAELEEMATLKPGDGPPPTSHFNFFSLRLTISLDFRALILYLYSAKGQYACNCLHHSARFTLLFLDVFPCSRVLGLWVQGLVACGPLHTLCAQPVAP